MPAYKDVEIRIPRARAGGNGPPFVHDIEITVEGSARWRSTSSLSLEELDPGDAQYGAKLGAQVASANFIRALDQAGLTRGECLRLRLLLDEDVEVPHWVRWERMCIPIDGVEWAPAIHPKIAFSRHIPVERPDEEPPDTTSFRLLYAIANPEGLELSKVIDVEGEIANFLSTFDKDLIDRRIQVSVLAGRTPISVALSNAINSQGWTLLSGNTTLLNLSRFLQHGYHGLHILGHGGYNPASGVGTLWLESEKGGKDAVTDEQLQSWITRELQLVVFQACQSGPTPAEGQPPFTGLAPHLIRLGVPAAVAMQDRVEMRDAQIFFHEFYRALMDDGLVDVAVNRGRQVLQGRQDSPDEPDPNSWSIPALFSRLRSGRLWQPDPLRQSLVTALEALTSDSGQPPLPLEVIEHTRGVADYDPAMGASGPRFSLVERFSNPAGLTGKFTILTGGRGYSKSAQLTCLLREFGDNFLKSQPDAAMPVLLSLPELAGRSPNSWPQLERVWTGRASQEEMDRLSSRRFLFLINGEEEMAGGARERALEAIHRLQKLPSAGFVLVADEALLPSLVDGSDDYVLLVIQPLAWPRVSVYLKAIKGDSARAVQQQIERQGLTDLASQPRFLEHLLELSARGVPLTSRSRILDRICATYLAKANGDLVPKSCIEEAARLIGWAIQNSQVSELAGTPLYQCLTAARAGREFALSDLMRELVTNCRLLVPSGEEGVRFAYPALQSYFAAKCLAAKSDRNLIADITASLGRVARIRRWEKVLILLASMLPEPGDLLRSILAGSPLLEGEQLFLAVRCYQEAVAERDSGGDTDHDVEQMVDALIWRSSWDPLRTYSERRQALQRLVTLAQLYKPGRAEIVPHLVALACDPIPSKSARPNREKYDWAGIRQVAATGSVHLREETTAYIREKRPELEETLDTWLKFDTEPGVVCALLERDDPRSSVIAAFALIQSEREEDRKTLISTYEHLTNLDVTWGIVEALSGLESAWVQQHVVAPWIKQSQGATEAEAEVRNSHICYLIQTTSLVDPDARKFLDECLRSGTPWLQGRALRALAKLQDDDIEEWLRPLCENILSCKADGIDCRHMKTTNAQLADSTLQRSALEALADIGDAGSLAVVRTSRVGYGAGSYDLRQLSFQVAEEMYWRLTGGMNKESYTSDALQSA